MQKISIITPVFNSSLYIRDCIISILNQSYTNFEHILIDDCSTDDSVKIIKEFSMHDNRVKLIQLTENGGAGIARNIGIEAAEGRFIGFLDADDYWHKDKLKIQLDFMLKNNYSFTYTQYYIVDENSNIQGIVKSPVKVNYIDILRNGYIGCLTAMYDVDKIGKYYMPIIRKRQDWVLWIKILKDVGEAYGVPQALGYYRVGNNSLSSNKFKLIKHNFNVYYKVLQMGFMESCFRMLVFLFCHIKFKLFSVRKV